MTGYKNHPAKFFLLLVLFLLGVHCNKENIPPLSKIVVITTRGTIGLTSVACGGEITSNNVEEITERGVCWDTVGAPLVTGNKVVYGKGPGVFSTEITSLVSARDYYLRAYAKTSIGVIYGNEMKFTTLALAQIKAAPPTGVTANTAIFNGEVVSDGGAVITERGVCWNTLPDPTISNSKASSGSGIGVFTVEMTGLTMGTAYYARGYAITFAGISYGSEVKFSTLGLPAISTAAVTSITQSTAVSGGSITSDGGASISARGVCWGTESLPTISGNKTIDGTGAGAFTSTLTGLLLNTKYYIRSYASNSVGTGYGEELSFTTIALSVPTLVTSSVTNVTETSAQSGGTVISDGGSPVLSRGICYSDYPVELIVGQPLVKVIQNGSGMGTYISSTNLLYPFTWYHLRAYATNAVGTGYGESITFTTLAAQQAPPTLRTPANNSTIGCCLVTFSWNISVFGEFSSIQVSSKVDFSEPQYFDQTLHNSGVFSTSTGGTTYSIRMDDPALNGTWYWRVRSGGSGTVSPWSEVRSFIFSN